MVRRLPCVGFLGIQALAVSLGLRLVWRFNSKRGVAQGAGRGRSVRSKREMRPAAGSPQRRISGTRGDRFRDSPPAAAAQGLRQDPLG